jgi:dTDP-4-dehydrorhamnose 3,5-epimerase
MIFTETVLKGAFVIDLERLEDERGFFARAYCEREFSSHGIDVKFVQCNISLNRHKGTLRGMHYQRAPFEEAKLVQCWTGAIYDVIVDLRPESTTFGKWYAAELTGENTRMLFIPEGFAHGFLTLEDHTRVFYHMSEFYEPGYSRGFRWNDPFFNIRWPEEVRVISIRDREYPDFGMEA